MITTKTFWQVLIDSVLRNNSKNKRMITKVMIENKNYIGT